MIRPTRLRTAVERLDQPANEAELATGLDHLSAVNRWLGGRRAVLRSLAPLVTRGSPISILDAGTGAGDIPRALVAWAHRQLARVRITAVDRHRQTVRIARERTRIHSRITIARTDVLALPFRDRTFDFALLSLTLHHLDDDARPAALRELRRVTRRAVLVNELDRTWPHLIGAKLLSWTLWRRDPVTRHDAPVSVRRGFTPTELLDCAREAGFTNARVRRFFFYRLVLIADAREPASETDDAEARSSKTRPRTTERIG